MNFKRQYWFLTFFALILITKKSLGTNKKPNVIIIITDDQGYGDIAAHGNSVIKTPQMDKLYQESVRLTNFHTGTTCAPSRSGLMGGIDGHRAGVWHTIGGCNILREKFTLMPQVFKQNGYSTAMYGKWHLGDAYPYLPENRGFDTTLCHGGGGIGQTPDYWGNDYFDDTYLKNGKPEKFKGYCTDVFFNEAITFIEKNKEKPFFLYLSTNAPHGPFNVPKKYYDIYENETTINNVQKAFYGMITNIDDNIGLLNKKLKELKIKDDTILIFMTDNGTSVGHKVIKGTTYGYNADMRGHKGSPYDGGHRVPFFIKWNNGGIKGGVDIKNIAMNYDVLPTLIDLCGLEKNAKKYDGISLKPLLKQKAKTWKHRYTIVDNNRVAQPVKWRSSAVMDDEWRLINGKKLYHIIKDKGQANDVAEKHPKKVKEMITAYEKWWQYVSKDFSYYEAYKVGEQSQKETTITVHDLHHDETKGGVAWAQNYIRDPYSGKRKALMNGYWMIDVVQEGEYQIELRRWPKEANLPFNANIPKLGETTPWYKEMPKSKLLDIENATLQIAGLQKRQSVNLKKTNVSFKTYLSKGRQQLQAFFTNKNQEKFASFYLYIKKM